MAESKPKIYIETSVVSYAVGRLSRDIHVLSHQEITRDWWQDRLADFDAHVSRMVIFEVGRGDPEIAAKRLELIADFPVLEAGRESEALAEEYIRSGIVPGVAARDAAHIALATIHGMVYLASWNLRHIVGGEVRKRVGELNAQLGYATPVICTPEELR